MYSSSSALEHGTGNRRRTRTDQKASARTSDQTTASEKDNTSPSPAVNSHHHHSKSTNDNDELERKKKRRHFSKKASTTDGTSTSTRSTETVIQRLMSEGRASRADPDGVHNVITCVLRYAAENTKFFSDRSFTNNFKKVSENIDRIHKEALERWKRKMLEAVISQNLSQIKRLVKVNGFDLNAEIGPVMPPEKGWPEYRHTALTWASLQGNLNFVKQLVDEGASPEALTADDLSALNFAAMKDSNLHVLKYFVENGFFEMGADYCGKWLEISPLISASAHGALECVQYLLGKISKSAEVNHQDSKGLTPLHHAAIGGHLDVMKLLVDSGACYTLRDNSWRDVLHLLIVNHHKYPEGVMNKCLEYFVEEKKIYLNQPDERGSTALHEACQRGMVSVARYLIEHGADIEAKRKGWETPMWSAITALNFPRKKAKSMVSMMVEKKANMEVKSPIGLTMSEFCIRISKNRPMADALEEAQKTVRMKRMKELSEQRKQILTSSSLDNVDNGGKNLPASGSSSTTNETKSGKKESEEKWKGYRKKKFGVLESSSSSESEESDLSSDSDSNDDLVIKAGEQELIELSSTTSSSSSSSSSSDDEDDKKRMPMSSKKPESKEGDICTPPVGTAQKKRVIQYEEISSETDFDETEGNKASNKKNAKVANNKKNPIVVKRATSPERILRSKKKRSSSSPEQVKRPQISSTSGQHSISIQKKKRIVEYVELSESD